MMHSVRELLTIAFLFSFTLLLRRCILLVGSCDFLHILKWFLFPTHKFSYPFYLVSVREFLLLQVQDFNI